MQKHTPYAHACTYTSVCMHVCLWLYACMYMVACVCTSCTSVQEYRRACAFTQINQQAHEHQQTTQIHNIPKAGTVTLLHSRFKTSRNLHICSKLDGTSVKRLSAASNSVSNGQRASASGQRCAKWLRRSRRVVKGSVDGRFVKSWSTRVCVSFWPGRSISSREGRRSASRVPSTMTSSVDTLSRVSDVRAVCANGSAAHSSFSYVCRRMSSIL